MFSFSSGRLIGSQLSSTGALLSPIEFGTLQNVTIDAKVDLKELYTAKRFPVAVADGKGKIDITAQAATINAQLFGLVFGSTSSQGGGVAFIADEVQIVPSTPYTITLNQTPDATVMLPSVLSVQNGVLIQYNVLNNTGTPVAGVSCKFNGTTGIVFASGDAAETVLVSYYYDISAPNASTNKIANVAFGSAKAFSLALCNTTNNANDNHGDQLIVVLNRVIAPSFKMDFKLDDWLIPDFTMQAFADASGNIGNFYINQ